jgi:hypothetical protein
VSLTITHDSEEVRGILLPLSEAQEGIWLGHQRAKNPSIYNAAQLLVLDASARLDCLERAIAHQLC